jgi:hypothetical protein
MDYRVFTLSRNQNGVAGKSREAWQYACNGVKLGFEGFSKAKSI